jgi:hypothetical protein
LNPKEQELTMRYLLVATVASLSIANASFALAQAAVQEPGAYAFYHPEADVLNAGRRADPRDAQAALPVGRPTHAHTRARAAD